MPRLIPAVLFFHVIFASAIHAADEKSEAIGARPYEMQWAGRNDDSHPPLIDFENLDGWTVETTDAKAAISRSRQQQLWGEHVGKLVYRSEGNQPRAVIRPREPIKIAAPFDCVNFWVYGNNWDWVPDAETPQVAVRVLLRNAKGEALQIDMGRVRWQEWWLMHQRLTPAQLALAADGAVFEGIEIIDGRNRQDRELFFDNLSFYKEPLAPLSFEPRPLRGVDLPAGQTVGTNTGPGRLPFPTREETILPDNLCKNFKTSLEQDGEAYVFRYRGDDGELVYRYVPRSGDLGDVEVQWSSPGGSDGEAKPYTKKFRPLVDGGVFFYQTDLPEKHIKPEKISAISCRREGNTVASAWKCTHGGRSVDLVYTLRLWQKSLVVDVKCTPCNPAAETPANNADADGQVGEFRIGRAEGVDDPRLVTIPYLVGASTRPAVLVAGKASEPLFTFAIIDHTRSNASQLWFENEIDGDRATYNGGSRYLPKTDGRRNACFERLFLTVSPRFEEILPNIPNPKSPWMHVAGERVWRAHGASDREKDYAYWQEVARHGMDKILITDHETGWRDGGESFTFRTKAAPGKGGDDSQRQYAEKIHALGFRYGIYNNYTDYAPVNEHWNEDCVTRLSDGNWQASWPRCYNPKPVRAVEFESRLAPIIQEKFRLDTAYCDVHTAVMPWSYVDYDARVPGAATFAATFYAYGEIMLHQKQTWNGPVYSEGNNHWYYCGLTDGNYAQDQAARLPVNPWLVDFDLRKMHPLCCNFGMGMPSMFFSGDELNKIHAAGKWEDALDRFLAATLAFGHTGFLVMEGGMPCALRSYYCLQQVHARYALQNAVDIRYADAQGKLLATSEAVAAGAHRRSQIATTYDDGLTVFVNGHADENWNVAGASLPPNGWLVQDPKQGKLEAWSKTVDGHRADYVDSPAYVYADGRGRFTRFAKAAADGKLIVKRLDDKKHPAGTVSLIPVGCNEPFGVSLAGRPAAAVAFDKEGKQLGPAETRLSRDMVFVVPAANAFSYILTPLEAAQNGAPAATLKCDRISVVPGERVAIVCEAASGGQGSEKTSHEFVVPKDARPSDRLWHKHQDAWLDFTVVPLVDASLASDADAKTAPALRLTLTSRAAAPLPAKVELAGQAKTVELLPEKPCEIRFDRELPTAETVSELPLTVTSGDFSFQKAWWLKSELETVDVARLPETMQRTGQCLRGQAEEAIKDSSAAAVYKCDNSCGNVLKQCLFMHPPYQGGTGYAFAAFAPVELPAAPAATFHCQIGKRDGSDAGDGILFRIAVIDSDGKETVVAERQWKEHAWTPLAADLSPWAGRKIQVKLIADCGPADNTSGDWACWAEMKVQSTQPVLRHTLHDKPVELRH